jgi:hypothetical protein
MTNTNNSNSSFGLIVAILFVMMIGILLLNNSINKEKEEATTFCRNKPDSCDCKVNITNVGFGQYSHKSYYVTYKENGKNITKEF